MKIYQPFRNPYKINEDAGFVQDQIQDRVNSEDNYIWAKGYPLIRSEDIEK